jgi:uncharacterized protein (TIGR03118 family)
MSADARCFTMKDTIMYKPQQLNEIKDAARSRMRLSACLVAVAATGLMIVAPSSVPAATALNSYTRTNLIASNSSFGALLVDKNLTNPWGLATYKESALFVSDNKSGMVTAYFGGTDGLQQGVTVQVPGGNPTGQVVNSDSGAFPVGGPSGSQAYTIVATDSIGSTQSPGEIAAWNGGSQFVIEDSPAGGPGGQTPAGAVFKGLAWSRNPAAGPELFATDVANASVDIFNRDFGPVSAPAEFQDPAIPAGYTPFGIHTIGGDIYVTYGKQNAQKTNVVKGAGLGYVDVYSVDGVLLRHLISGGAGSPLNAPWGLVIAPSGMGPFSGDLLVGNFGNGQINAFSPATGAYRGTLDGSDGTPVTINGLLGLWQGSLAFGGAKRVVFSAGPDGHKQGLVGILAHAR